MSSGVSDQVRLKLACSATEASMRLEILVTELETLHYLDSEQQRRRSDCADAQADLRLCCSPMFAYDIRQICLWFGSYASDAFSCLFDMRLSYDVASESVIKAYMKNDNPLVN